LKYLEGENIIHRDIKPENILFRSKEEGSEIALVDLGFATYVKDYNKLFTRCGTPGFVAPEVLHDKPYNCKADVFSVGVILYIMLTGNVPFASKTYEGLVEANMDGVIDLDLTKFGLDLTESSNYHHIA
jgi:calcium/calmodulin-dependent protein kinase I